MKAEEDHSYSRNAAPAFEVGDRVVVDDRGSGVVTNTPGKDGWTVKLDSGLYVGVDIGRLTKV